MTFISYLPFPNPNPFLLLGELSKSLFRLYALAGGEYLVVCEKSYLCPKPKVVDLADYTKVES